MTEAQKELRAIMAKVKKAREGCLRGTEFEDFEHGARTAFGLILDWLEKRDERLTKKGM